jgi:hypothetical protein
MDINSFATSWGSHIAPYIQRQVIKRIKNNDDTDTIIENELLDILDKHPQRVEEALEIIFHCEEILQKNCVSAVE